MPFCIHLMLRVPSQVKLERFVVVSFHICGFTISTDAREQCGKTGATLQFYNVKTVYFLILQLQIVWF